MEARLCGGSVRFSSWVGTHCQGGLRAKCADSPTMSAPWLVRDDPSELLFPDTDVISTEMFQENMH